MIIQHDLQIRYFLSDGYFRRRGQPVKLERQHGLRLTMILPGFTAQHLTHNEDGGRAFSGIS